MSTSLLSHAFGIRGYEYVRTSYEGGRVTFTIRQDPRTGRCSACGSAEVHPRGHVERHFRALPIGNRPTTLALPIPRVGCRSRGVVHQVEVPFADPRRSYAKAFGRYALDLGRCMTIRDLAAHPGVGWDLIKDIQRRDLSRRFARPKLKRLRRIAIGEIAVAKGHRYPTLVMDLDGGAVVHAGGGKGADAPRPFWKRRRPSGAKIEAVAMDICRRIGRRWRPICPGRRSCPTASTPSSSSTRSPPISAGRCIARPADALHKRAIKGAR